MTSFSGRIGFIDCACVVDVEADGSRLMRIGYGVVCERVRWNMKNGLLILRKDMW